MLEATTCEIFNEKHFCGDLEFYRGFNFCMKNPIKCIKHAKMKSYGFLPYAYSHDAYRCNMAGAPFQKEIPRGLSGQFMSLFALGGAMCNACWHPPLQSGCMSCILLTHLMSWPGRSGLGKQGQPVRQGPVRLSHNWRAFHSLPSLGPNYPQRIQLDSDPSVTLRYLNYFEEDQ